MIELADGTVRFTHPLLASVLYQGLSADERQRAHRRLAALVDDPLARARHLALSADAAGRRARGDARASGGARADAQGAPIVAAELGEHALRLTPPDDAADRSPRAAAAARAHLAAGEVERARALAADLLASALAGRRARRGARRSLAEVEIEEPRSARSRCCARRCCEPGRRRRCRRRSTSA